MFLKATVWLDWIAELRCYGVCTAEGRWSVLEHDEIEMCAYRIEPSQPSHIDLEQEFAAPPSTEPTMFLRYQKKVRRNSTEKHLLYLDLILRTRLSQAECPVVQVSGAN